MRHESIVDAIGRTPLVRLSVHAPDGVEAYGKLELQNPFGMKDRVARQVILEARRTGALAEGAPIVESSSGTMALGLALVGTYLGHPVHIVTDPRIDPVTLVKLETMGCVVHVVEAMTGQGWQSARLELLSKLMATLPGAFWPRQYSNPQNPLAYRALADELLADLGSVDVLVGSVGSGGSLCGTARALLERLPDLRVVAVDCVGSVLFGQPDIPTRRQSGLGNSLYPANIDYAIFDEVHWLSDDEAFDATRSLAREQKVFAGNTSGSVYRVLTHLAARAEPGTRLVGIMADRGDRYVDSVFRCDVAGPVAAGPAEVGYGSTVTQWSFASMPRRNRPLLLFVESNTTGTGMLALTTAMRMGLEPVLLTADPDRYPGLAETGCRIALCDTDDVPTLHTTAGMLSAGRTIAGVTTTSEFFVGHSAALTAALGLEGQAPEALAVCRDKSRTRAVLLRHGLRQPRYVAVRRVAEIEDAVATAGLPCVVKPADDSGSRNVLWCDDLQAAIAHAGKVLAVTRNVRGQPTAGIVLVEEVLVGPEYSAEMFGTDDGMRCVGITQRTVSPLPYFVETGHQLPAVVAADVAAEIAEVARRALTATGFRRGPAHVELKLTAAGPVVVEINARLAGGMIAELIRLATGVDLLEQQVRAAAGLPVRLEPSRSRRAGIRFLVAAEPGVLAGFSGVAQAERVPGIDRLVVTGVAGREVGPPRDAYDRLGYVIAVGDTSEQVEGALDAAAGAVKISVEQQLVGMDATGAR